MVSRAKRPKASIRAIEEELNQSWQTKAGEEDQAYRVDLKVVVGVVVEEGWMEPERIRRCWFVRGG